MFKRFYVKDSFNSIFFFTESNISSFSIIFVKKYLLIKNLIASQNILIFSFFPYVELPRKKTGSCHFWPDLLDFDQIDLQ